MNLQEMPKLVAILKKKNIKEKDDYGERRKWKRW
jgi:hypothetical protein